MTAKLDKPEPGAAERSAIASACEASRGRLVRPVVAFEDGALAASHSDHAGWTNQLADALGSVSDAFLTVGLAQLERLTRRRGASYMSDPTSLNAGLALVAAVDPDNELEGAMAIQMAGTHALAVEMMVRAMQAESADVAQLYASLGAKLQNTFSAQVMALTKLRGGGKQQVEVRHVYVNGNAVIGDGTQALFSEADRGRGRPANCDQSHAQGLADLPRASVPTLRSQDSSGDGVFGPRRRGAETVSDARGSKSGSPRRRG